MHPHNQFFFNPLNDNHDLEDTPNRIDSMMNNIDRSNNSNDIIMADDDNNVWSPLRTRSPVDHSNCASLNSQRSHSNISSKEIDSEIGDSSREEVQNRFGLFDNEIVLTCQHSVNENISSDVSDKKSGVESSLPDSFNYLDSSCSGTSTLKSAPRHMQISNKSAINLKPKKKQVTNYIQ